MAYEIEVKIKEEKPTEEYKKQKIEKFQSIFSNVASKYYINKRNKEKNR